MTDVLKVQIAAVHFRIDAGGVYRSKSTKYSGTLAWLDRLFYYDFLHEHFFKTEELSYNKLEKPDRQC